jgi:phospholipase/lecithinase/hemolysin
MSQNIAKCADGRRWTNLYSFGDSFSDSGAGYIDSNGLPAVTHMARVLGIPFTFSTDPDGARKGLNFATSGAKSGEGNGFQVSCLSRGVPEKTLGRGILTQVQDFSSRVSRGQIDFAPDCTLFFLAGGLNDQKLTSAETVRNLRIAIENLYAAGARNVFLALLPARIPMFKDVGERLNPALRELQAEIAIDGLRIWLSSWGEYFDDILTHPNNNGLVNTTHACAGRALFDEDPTPVGDPGKFFFYHDGHPSSAVHQRVGARLAGEALEKRARAGVPS